MSRTSAAPTLNGSPVSAGREPTRGGPVLASRATVSSSSSTSSATSTRSARSPPRQEAHTVPAAVA
ncbi:hypothetical protein [Amycolatopsis plumensis]|uniref:hypothetical protein n=1 Tax=Amycolatopsis plumensis TaxID=236508 RepID=UPI003618FE2A